MSFGLAGRTSAVMLTPGDRSVIIGTDGQLKPLIDPAGDTTGHQLHRPSQPGQPHGGTRRAIAMRAGAIHHEQGLRGVLRQPRFDDLGVRDVDRAGDVPALVVRRAAGIDEDEAQLSLLQGVVRVPAIGFEGERRFEMLQRLRGRRGGDLGDGVRHGCSRVRMETHCSAAAGRAQLAKTTRFDQIMPIARRRRTPPNPLVAALVYDGLCGFEFACAAEVFGLPRPELQPGWYRFETCAAERGPLRGQYGMRVTADAGLERLADAGTIIIPGWKGLDVPVPTRVLDALREAHARGARLLTICSGAFVLAATGLLDGRRATTHWRYADALQRRYPRIKVDPAVLYVDEGQLLTSAGSAAGLDLCLHLVRRDHGPDIANQVARRLVIPPHRDGGQAQFVERPVARREADPLSRVMDTMLRRLARPQPIAE